MKQLSKEDLTKTKTVTDLSLHPVAAFFKKCGLVESDFPRFRILIEVLHNQFDRNTCYIPLRVPTHAGFLYESFWRISKFLELPVAGSKKHRKFVELEWAIREQALLEEQEHPALTMISGEVECFACKTIFVPEVDLIDDTSVKITCPSCLQHWSVKIESKFFEKDQVVLLNDQYVKDPSTFNRHLGISQVLHSSLYFRSQFEERQDGSSLEWLFGDQTGLLQVSTTEAASFEAFVRSFINFVSLRYYETSPVGEARTSRLDQTEVSHKEVITSLTPIERMPEDVQAFPAPKASDITLLNDEQDLEQRLQKFRESRLKEAKELSSSPVTKSSSAPLAISASVVTLIFSGLGFFLYLQSQNAQTSLSKVERVSEEPLSLESLESEIILTEEVASENLSVMSTPSETIGKELETKEIAESKEVTEVKDVKVQEPKTPVAVAEEKPALIAVESETPQATQPTAVKEPNPVPNSEEANADQTKQAVVNSIYRQAAAHLRQSQFLEAADKFQEVIQLDPGHFSAHLNLGKSYFQNRRLEEAKKAFTSAQSIDASNAEVYRSLGLVHFYSREFGEALSAFEKYLSLDGAAPDRAQIEQLMAQMKSTLETSQSLLR